MEAPLRVACVRDAVLSTKTTRSMKRRLRRNASRLVDVDVKSAMVIKGGIMKDYMVLPTTVIDGTECVRIGNTRCCRWLVTMLSGHGYNRGYNGAISNLVRDCIDASRTEQPAEEEGPDESQEARSQEEVRGPKRGRSVFGDVDDDDEGGVPVVKALAKTCAKKIGWVQCQVRGRDMHFHVGPLMMLHVPAKQAAIGTVVAELTHRAGEGRRRAKKKHDHPNAFKILLTSHDKNKIYWNGDTWSIRYRDADGKTKNFQRTYVVPELARHVDTVASAKVVLQRVRVDWNRLDCTARQRLMEA